MIVGVRHRFAGMFEIDHYLSIAAGERSVSLVDEMSPTLRCHQVLSVCAVMHSYLCERLLCNEVGGVDQGEGWRDLLGLPSASVLEEFPHWVAKLALSELWLVGAVHYTGRYTERKSAYEIYCDKFCVRETASGVGVPYTLRVVRSSAAFIERWALPMLGNDYAGAKRQYERVRARLGQIERYAVGAFELAKAGKVTEVLRDRVLEFDDGR